MLIAHLPAGYMLTRYLQSRHKTKKYLWFGLAGSILPDIDMLLFIPIHHHLLPTHWPLFWAGIAYICFLVCIIRERGYAAWTIFFSGVGLHLLLDCIAAPLFVAMPYLDYKVELITVPAMHSHWIWSFIFHWSFLFEIAIVISASCVLIKEKRHETENPHC